MTKHLHHSRSIIAVPVVTSLVKGETISYKEIFWRIRNHKSGAATLYATIKPFKILGGWGKSIEYYCRKPTNETINRWVTKVLFNLLIEEKRIKALEKLDKLVNPFIDNNAFLKWVDEQEKTLGESRYDSMTEDVICQWITKVNKWKKENI